MTSPSVARREDDAVEQRLGLLRRMHLAAAVLLQPLRPGADREQPVGAHLQLVVQRLHRLVVEGVARLWPHRHPDQRLMRVGEAAPAEIRHGVGLAPHHVVQHPEAEILEDGADAEDVVIAADHPERAFRLEHAAAFDKPGAGEGVIGGEAAELVPIVVDAVDLGIVGPKQLVVELKIVRRVGKDEIDALRREFCQLLDAVADNDLVVRKPRLPRPTHTHGTTRLRKTRKRLPLPYRRGQGHAEGSE